VGSAYVLLLGIISDIESELENVTTRVNNQTVLQISYDMSSTVCLGSYLFIAQTRQHSKKIDIQKL